MITGDHQLTARAIASELGIAEQSARVLTGQELQRMSDNELEEQVDLVSIYARVAPEHKLRIVQALQRRGRFVAMTGDGVRYTWKESLALWSAKYLCYLQRV